MCTFGAAFSSACIFTYIKSKKQGITLLGKTSKRLMFAVSIPMITGGLFVLRLIQLGAAGLIAPACLLFYGLALLNASKSTFEEIRFSEAFNWISIPRILFALLGIFISSTFLLNYLCKTAINEATEENELTKKNAKANRNNAWNKFQTSVFGNALYNVIALKLEYKGALISLTILNVLLASVNATDIIYVWLNQTYKPGFEWVEFVHNSTEILVCSILLAMAVLLCFFRGNLNFLRKNKWLKIMAYVWLFQNMILTISVGIRNYSYILHMGMAYKRIGLFIFIIMVAIGMITIFIKISKRKTTYYLLRTNGWVAYIVFILSSTIHWDEQIATFNLAHKDTATIDVAFLLSLSDKTIHILDQYKSYLALPQTDLQSRYFSSYQKGYYADKLEWRKRAFKKEFNQHSLLSWNYTDKVVNAYLNNVENNPTHP